MPGMAAMAMGAAPVVGGALLGAAVGQLRGPDMREGIKQDLELLEQMPEIEAARREALRRSIDDRIDELIVAEDTARQLRATASSYEGSWRDIVLFLCTVLFSIVWWSVDHDRDSWLPVFITTIVASVVAAGYAVRGLRRSMRRCVVAPVVVSSRKRRPLGRTRVAAQADIERRLVGPEPLISCALGGPYRRARQG